MHRSALLTPNLLSEQPPTLGVLALMQNETITMRTIIM